MTSSLFSLKRLMSGLSLRCRLGLNSGRTTGLISRRWRADRRPRDGATFSGLISILHVDQSKRVGALLW